MNGTGSPYRYRPGQAFLAARRQSHVQLHQDTLGSTDIEDLTRTLNASPRRRFHRDSQLTPGGQTLFGNDGKMRITRRQSAATIARQPIVASPLQKLARASFDDNIVATDDTSHLVAMNEARTLPPPVSPTLPTFSFPRSSNETARRPPITYPRVSFDAPSSSPPLPPPPPPPPHRSSLEAKVHRGLRGLSIDTTANQTHIFASTQQRDDGMATTSTSGAGILLQVQTPHCAQKRNANIKSNAQGLRTGNANANKFIPPPPRKKAWTRYKGPRLQKSTSGLAFEASSDGDGDEDNNDDGDGDGYGGGEVTGRGKENVEP